MSGAAMGLSGNSSSSPSTTSILPSGRSKVFVRTLSSARPRRFTGSPTPRKGVRSPERLDDRRRARARHRRARDRQHGEGRRRFAASLAPTRAARPGGDRRGDRPARGANPTRPLARAVPARSRRRDRQLRSGVTIDSSPQPTQRTGNRPRRGYRAECGMTSRRSCKRSAWQISLARAGVRAPAFGRFRG